MTHNTRRITPSSTLASGLSLALCLLATTAMSGCKHDQDTSTEAPAPIAQTEIEAIASLPDEPDERGTIEIAEDIRSACGVAEAKAYFAYDSAKIDGAEALLAQVADCFDHGPLAGEALCVTGHADPRGSDEYNQELGRERAESVASFLQQRGVESDRIDVESMGEALASDDPENWRYDRKVVLELRS